MQIHISTPFGTPCRFALQHHSAHHADSHFKSCAVPRARIVVAKALHNHFSKTVLGVHIAVLLKICVALGTALHSNSTA
jgi:hypothetical protein